MAAHRYWRARLLKSYSFGDVVSLSEFGLLNSGVRVDLPATLTCSASPISGSLSSLKDESSSVQVSLPTGCFVQWDFGGSPVEIDDIFLGSGALRSEFLGVCRVEGSDDGVAWNLYLNDIYVHALWYAWPGPNSYTATFEDKFWGSASNLTINPSNRTQLISTNLEGHGIASAARYKGVLQFEIQKTVWSEVDNFGVVRLGQNPSSGSSNGWAIDPISNLKRGLGVFTAFNVGAVSGSTVFGVVIDFNTGNMTIYKDGISLGVAFSVLAGEVLQPSIYRISAALSHTITLRTSGFVYPIVGAEPWTKPRIASDALLITPEQSYVQGFSELPFSGFNTSGLNTLRPNFFFDPAARGRIVGTVARDADPANIPLRRRVRLYRDRDGMLIREGWSDRVTGAYQFDYIEENEAYTVIANDYEFFYRAVVADNLTLANGGVELI